MIFYIAIYISASLFAFLYSKTESKNLAFIFKWTSFLILFLPLALRYNIGVDYENYIWYITSGEYNKFEIGFVIFIKILLALNLDFHWFFVIPAFLTLFIIYKYIPKEYFWLFIASYIVIYYAMLFNQVRQLFGLSIFLFAVMAYLKQQKWKMLFWVFVSCLFHNSLIALGLVLLFCELFNVNFLNRWSNIFILICIILSYKMHIGEIILNNIVVHTHYDYYINDKVNANVASNFSTGFGVLARFLLYGIVLFFLNVDKSSITMKRFYNLTCMYIFALAISRILTMEIYIFYRFEDIFSIGLIFGLLLLKKSKNILSIYSVFFLLIILSIKYLLDDSGVIVPYKTILG